MGLFKAPQSGIALFGPKMRWTEPAMFEARLKNTVGSRLAMMVSLPVGGAVLMPVLAVIAAKPGFTPGIAFLVGVILGTIAIVPLFARDLFGGSVRVDKRGIHRSRPNQLAIEYEDWPYGAIDRCDIYPEKATKHGIAILEVHTFQERDQIGIPSRVDLAKLANFLQGHGVAVSLAKGYVAYQPSVVDRMKKYWVAPVGLLVILVAAIVAGTIDPGTTEKGDQEAGTSLAGPTMPSLPSSAREDAIRSAEEASRRALETRFPKTEPAGSVEDPFGGTTASGSMRPEHGPRIPDDLPLRPGGSRSGPDRFRGRLGPPRGGGPSGGAIRRPTPRSEPVTPDELPEPTDQPYDPFK